MSCRGTGCMTPTETGSRLHPLCPGGPLTARSFTWCQVFPAQEQAPSHLGPLLPELPAWYVVGASRETPPSVWGDPLVERRAWAWV